MAALLCIGGLPIDTIQKALLQFCKCAAVMFEPEPCLIKCLLWIKQVTCFLKVHVEEQKCIMIFKLGSPEKSSTPEIRTNEMRDKEHLEEKVKGGGGWGEGSMLLMSSSFFCLMLLTPIISLHPELSSCWCHQSDSLNLFYHQHFTVTFQT